jgi:glutathione S-transferase
LTEDFLGGSEPNLADFYLFTCFKLFDILYYFNTSEFPAKVNAWSERMLKLDAMEIYGPESRFSDFILPFMYNLYL